MKKPYSGQNVGSRYDNESAKMSSGNRTADLTLDKAQTGQ